MNNQISATFPTLALRPREAAKAIGVSERTLWAMTKSREIPYMRLGRIILYSVESLRAWLEAKTVCTAASDEQGAERE
jgi:excisionase family DNA binding protein